jgi:hypothetical protein
MLRLKFYCSWTRNFSFFIFSLSVCLIQCSIVHHLSLLISLVLHFVFPFFFFLISFFFFFLFLSLFC